MMDARVVKGRSTRKARLGDAERKAKAARLTGRGRLPRVVKARGRVPAPANDTLPSETDLTAGPLPDEATIEPGLTVTEETAAAELIEEPSVEEAAELASSEETS